MKRQALLIACPPTSTGQAGYCEELQDFKKLLCSAAGGGWTQNEVAIIERAEPAVIQMAMRDMEAADFALIVVKAPGEEMKISRPWTEVQVRTFAGTMNEQDFNPGCARLVQLFDCVPVIPLAVRPTVVEEGSTVAARATYEDAIGRAEGGVVKLFAAGPAGAMSLTESLLSSGLEWSRYGTGVLGLGDAVARAQGTQAEGRPAPLISYRGGRRMRDFPFCVAISASKPTPNP